MDKKTKVLIGVFGGMVATLGISLVFMIKGKNKNTEKDTKNGIADTLFHRDTRMVNVERVDISKDGKNFIKETEKFRDTAYQDSGGVWTIGYGHTGDVKKGDTITLRQAEKLFEDDLKPRVDAIRKTLKESNVERIEQNVFDMLVSHKYNTGSNNSALRYSEMGNNDSLHSWWNTHYITINGIYSNGLLNRRNKEIDVLKNGY